MEEAIRKAAKAILHADSLVITAGAGIGVDSGLPDFRGSEGFWRAYPAFATLGLRFEESGVARLVSAGPRAGLGILRPSPQFISGHAAAQRVHHFERVGQSTAWRGVCIHVERGRSVSEGRFCRHADCGVSRLDFSHAVQRSLQSRPLAGYCACYGRGKYHARTSAVSALSPLWSRSASQYSDVQRWGLAGRANGAAVSALSNLAGTVGGRANGGYRDGGGSAIPTARHMSESLMQHIGATLIRINPREAEGPAGTISLPMGAQYALEQIATIMAE